MAWLLVAGLSLWRPGFDPQSVHVVIVVDKVALAQVSIIPPMLGTHIHPHVALTRKQTGEIWEPSKNRRSFGNGGVLDVKVLLLFSSLKC